MTLTDNLHQEKMAEEGSPTMRIALTHQYKDSRITLKRTKKDELEQPFAALAKNKMRQRNNKNEETEMEKKMYE